MESFSTTEAASAQEECHILLWDFVQVSESGLESFLLAPVAAAAAGDDDEEGYLTRSTANFPPSNPSRRPTLSKPIDCQRKTIDRPWWE